MLSSNYFLFKKNAPEALRIVGITAIDRKSSAAAICGHFIL
jgi:phage terminase large subunit-like protein